MGRGQLDPVSPRCSRSPAPPPHASPFPGPLPPPHLPLTASPLVPRPGWGAPPFRWSGRLRRGEPTDTGFISLGTSNLLFFFSFNIFYWNPFNKTKYLFKTKK